LLEVNSPKKALKKASMQSQFIVRYVQELEKIKASLSKKSGVKNIAKVYERIGRIKQKYPSANKLFEITIEQDTTSKQAKNISWKQIEKVQTTSKEQQGKYFLRTNLSYTNEVLVWEVYNTIRSIESTFRVLKTDLDLRPIYHKNDTSTIAHLNLGLLAYWSVNTIRHQLKQQGFTKDWNKIKRIAHTQKVITTTGTNAAGKEIMVRKCSEPNKSLQTLQAILNIKPRPFIKLKYVVHKPELVIPQMQQYQTLRF
jgi:hypothetical protein